MKRCLALLVSGWFCVSSWADDAVLALQQQLQQIEQVHARFDQRQFDGNRQLLEHQQGQFWLRRPLQLRWQVEGDFAQLLLTDGATLWRYDPDLEQVIIQSLPNDWSSLPALLLGGDRQSLLEHYQVSRLTPNRYRLVPLNADHALRELTLQFGEGGAIDWMDSEDQLGQRTRLEFSGWQGDQPVADSLFQWQTPEGVEVVHYE